MNNARPQHLMWLAVATFFALIGLYGAVGIYARPLLDDLCLADYVRDLGIVGTVTLHYWNWSGNVIGLYYQAAGPTFQLYAIAPLALLVLWTATFTWFFREALALAGFSTARLRLPTLLIGAMLALSLVDVSPNIGQTLYWFNGTANYGPTAALFVMLLALLLRAVRLGASRAYDVAALLLTFSAVCGQITMVIYCVGLIVSALIFAFAYHGLPHRRDVIRLLGVSLAAAAVGAAIVVLTPGNDVRQAALEAVGLRRTGMVEALLRNVPMSLEMLIFSVGFLAPLTHLFLFAFGGFGALIFRPPALGNRRLPPRYRALVLPAAAALGFVVFYLGNFASAYTMGVLGVARAWAAPQSFWMVLVLLTGYGAGLCFRPVLPGNRKRTILLMALCAAAFAVVQAANLPAVVREYRDFAQQYDARIARIEAAKARGETSVTLPMYRPSLQSFMFLDDADDLVCLQRYYDLNAVYVESVDG